jgi:endonuclease-3
LSGLEKIPPDAKLDLDYSNPLELLIALILAAQARDELVRQITPELFDIPKRGGLRENTITSIAAGYR